MKTWAARYWPSSVVGACIAYIIGAFVLTFSIWAILPNSASFDGYINPTQTLFPAVLSLVFVNLLGPKLGLGLALILALLSVTVAYQMNKRSLRLGIVALVVYLALSAWLFISRSEIYALAGITQS